MKHLHKIIASVLLLTVAFLSIVGCSSAQAKVECPFTEITWNSTLEDVQALEGELQDSYYSSFKGTTYVYVYPKYTEDWNNYAGKLFNVIGKNLPEAAFDANETINVVEARFDWNAITIGQSLIVKVYTIGELGENPVDVENSDLTMA